MASRPQFANDTISTIVVAGSVTGASGVAPIAGGASPAMVGIAASTGAAGQSIVLGTTGNYTMTLPNAEPFKDCLFFAFGIGIAATDITFHVISFSAAGVIVYQANAAAVATNCDHYFFVLRIANG